ncbi:hypothetical protein DCC85_05965 [Paenibacillus sp. CAA11]|uniref:hypothetical protein n=1 Tax=Paenibacillus sp. CAA11 TaxID=1532905 RepID=UPI000D392CA9|nr:hypothetical protein [Paenibacillus sp. CAA11]AWB43814.1 hypothetical protein DCC85_05965 [Paenibacillus sp. CAA11]
MNIEFAGLAETSPLAVRGTIIKREDIHHISIDVIGCLLVHGHVFTGKLKVQGDCSIKKQLHAREVHNLGSLRLHRIKAGQILSSGYLAIKEQADAEEIWVDGAVRGNRLFASRTIELCLGSTCRAEQIKAGQSIIVKPSSRMLNTLMQPFRRLTCHTLKSPHINLYHTHAKLVEGEDIVIGPGCKIENIRYSRSLTIHPKSCVKHAVQVNSHE